MSEGMKKIWEAILKAFKDLQEKPSLETAQKGVSNVMKSVDKDTLKKGIKGIADKAQSVTGVDVSKHAEHLVDKVTETSTPSDRRMKFPYTFSAKVAHFPWKFYVKNNWIWRYYFIAFFICLPIFNYFSGMANTPANIQKWKEIRKAEKHEHQPH